MKTLCSVGAPDDLARRDNDYWLSVRHSFHNTDESGDPIDEYEAEPTDLVSIHKRLRDLVVDLEEEIHGDADLSVDGVGERAFVVGIVQRLAHTIIMDIEVTAAEAK